MKLLALATLLCAAPLAAAGDLLLLAPGAPAPTLEDVTWVKGEPVASWKPGHVYVLDFWATWCPPCKKSIPHLDRLADERAKDNVHVLGVAIWPKSKMVPTPDFVKEKGDDMSYGICEDIDGRTSATFMEASAQQGIPTCMVVDQSGNLAWIGNPLTDGLDAVVDEVLAGTWDTAAFGKAFVAEHEPKLKVMALQKDYAVAEDAGDWTRAAQAAGELFTLDPDNFAGFALIRYDALLKASDTQVAASFGRELAAGVFKANPYALNALAWSIVDPEQPRASPDLELAHLAGTRANDLTSGKDPSVLDTLARVVFLQGNVARAIELQQSAVENAPEEERSVLAKRLAEYQAAPH